MAKGPNCYQYNHKSIIHKDSKFEIIFKCLNANIFH